MLVLVVDGDLDIKGGLFLHVAFCLLFLPIRDGR